MKSLCVATPLLAVMVMGLPAVASASGRDEGAHQRVVGHGQSAGQPDGLATPELAGSRAGGGGPTTIFRTDPFRQVAQQAKGNRSGSGTSSGSASGRSGSASSGGSSRGESSSRATASRGGRSDDGSAPATVASPRVERVATRVRERDSEVKVRSGAASAVAEQSGSVRRPPEGGSSGGGSSGGGSGSGTVTGTASGRGGGGDSGSGSSGGSSSGAVSRGESRRGDGGRSDDGGSQWGNNRAVPRSGVRRARPYPYPYYYYRPNPWYYDRWGYGGFGLGYFYYSPWSWYGPSYYPGGGWGRDDGGVRLKVKPKDAEVLVDGYFAGIVDDFDGSFQSLKLDAGSYRVEVRKPGYETLSFDVRVQRDRTITFRGEMKEQP